MTGDDDDTILLKRATRTRVAHLCVSVACWRDGYRWILAAGWAPSCVLTMEDGLEVDLAAPDEADMEIARIARYLARLPRWLGHTDRVVSVAQHSVWVSDQLPSGLRRQGLLHDAAEAFIGDLPSPMKSFNPVFKAWEQHVWQAIARRHALPLALDPEVKRIDLLARDVETRDLRRAAWCGGHSGAPNRLATSGYPVIPPLVPLPAEAAEALYLARWAEIEEPAS